MPRSTPSFPRSFALAIMPVTLLLIGGCTPPDRPAPTEPLSTPTVEIASATAIQPDIVITKAQRQQTILVKVGQIIQIPDSFGFEWNIYFSPDVLLALTPPERRSKPGPEGWFFKVISPGTTTIVFESIPPLCPAGTTCPPNIVRLEFTIQAEP